MCVRKRFVCYNDLWMQCQERKKKNFVYEPNLKYQSSMLYGYEEVY